MCEEDYEYDEKPHVIIDNGTGYIKAGLSIDEGPRTVFPSCVGYPKYQEVIHKTDYKDFYVGNDAIYKKAVLKLNYPMEHGVVNNWDDMEKIWGYIFTNELRVAPEEHNVMLTEAPFNPKENREKMTQIMFETFNVPNLYIAIQAVLSLYSAGKTTGMVLDSGDGVTHTVPIFEGYSLPHAILRLDIAGRDLTEYMQNLLTEIGIRFSTTSEKEIVKDIKEKCIYIPLELEKESVKLYDYELPDGNHVIIKDQRIKCPEALFKPSMIGKEGLGIPDLCDLSIQKCDIDLRKDLYHNILLSGGNAMIKGLKERLTYDLKKIRGGLLSEIRVLPLDKEEQKKDEEEKEEKDKGDGKPIKPYNIKFAVWDGGKELSNISVFESNWISKTEYEEEGATILHRKCF